MPAANIALIADPHLSLLDKVHCGIPLDRTIAITEAVMEDLQRRQPDMAIWLGDLTHEGSDAVRSRFTEMARHINVPCLWMLGNHDVEYITKGDFAQQAVPCTRRHWMTVAGWNLVIIDAVRECSPENATGQFEEVDLQLLEAAASANTPLLVLAHHPLRDVDVDTRLFWNRLGQQTAPGVYIGGHSHRDVYETERNWHLLDIASCCRPPFGYHWLELTPEQLSITPIPVSIPGLASGPAEPAASEPVYPLSVPAGPIDADETERIEVAR